MKPVNTGGVPWAGHPWLQSWLRTPGENGAVGPLHGRHDEAPAMGGPVLTPSATEPPEPSRSDEGSPEPTPPNLVPSGTSSA